MDSGIESRRKQVNRMENMEELAGTDNIEGLQEKMDNIEALQEKWQGLSISNDFLFGKVMQDPCLCTELLQMILPDVEIGHIEYPELQKNMEQDRDAHGVRLDVYVKDGKGTVYDIEMQVANTKELPKRSRYYQGMIDLQLLDKGQHYKKLNQTYIIFICLFDAFGKGRHMYTFENICREDSGIAMGDGAVKIFLNAAGTLDDSSKALQAFLGYVAGEKPKDPYVEKLEEAVKKAKRNREWRHEYMTLLMRDQENQEIGEKNGKEKMVVNALVTTKSVIQTANILHLSEQDVREIAESKKLFVND